MEISIIILCRPGYGSRQRVLVEFETSHFELWVVNCFEPYPHRYTWNNLELNHDTSTSKFEVIHWYAEKTLKTKTSIDSIGHEGFLRLIFGRHFANKSWCSAEDFSIICICICICIYILYVYIYIFIHNIDWITVYKCSPVK